MQRSMVFILGGSLGLACGLAVGQLGAADLNLADEEIARLVVQLESLERDNARMEGQLEHWIGGAPALPADVEIAEPIPVEPDEDEVSEDEAAAEVAETQTEPSAAPDASAEATPEAEPDAVAEAEAEPNADDAPPPEPASEPPAEPAPEPASASDAPDIEDLLGELLEAEGDALVDAAPDTPAPSAPKSAPPKPAASGWGSGQAAPGWPADTPRNLQPAAVDAAVRAAVSGVGELAAVDCRDFPCVVAVQASDASEPCCSALQQRLRAIDGYLMYAGPSQPLTVGGRATVITTWYPAGSDVDLEALSRRMDALRRGL